MYITSKQDNPIHKISVLGYRVLTSWRTRGGREEDTGDQELVTHVEDCFIVTNEIRTSVMFSW